MCRILFDLFYLLIDKEQEPFISASAKFCLLSDSQGSLGRKSDFTAKMVTVT